MKLPPPWMVLLAFTLGAAVGYWLLSANPALEQLALPLLGIPQLRPSGTEA